VSIIFNCVKKNINIIFRQTIDMLENISPKLANNFYCEKCNYSCSKQSDYKKHTMTRKHQFSTNFNNSSTEKVADKYECNCGKSYKDRTGLWYHSKKCDFQTNTFDTKIFIDLLKQNQDFKEIILEQNIKLNEQNSKIHEQNNKIIQVLETSICNNTTNNQVNTINSNNKTFNLQVFLNEDCKDAMNISDFMSSIQLQLEELVSVGKLGFVEGISNIIIKNLKALDIRKRPLHCTDLKRETVYIKDNGVWVKDDEDNTKLRKVIKNVAFRNSKNTRLFKDKYPDCVRSESRLSDTYSIIIIEAMGGGSKTDPKESEDKILRRILKELTIDKSRYLS
jgi:hypothetical protein